MDFLYFLVFLVFPRAQAAFNLLAFFWAFDSLDFSLVTAARALAAAFTGLLAITRSHTEKITETKEILFEPKRAVHLVTDLLQTVGRDLLGRLVRLQRLSEGGELAQLLQLLLSLRSQTPPSLLARGRLAASLETTSPIWVTVVFTIRLRELLTDITPRSPSNTQNSHIEKTIKKTKRKRFDFYLPVSLEELVQGIVHPTVFDLLHTSGSPLRRSPLVVCGVIQSRICDVLLDQRDTVCTSSDCCAPTS